MLVTSNFKYMQVPGTANYGRTCWDSESNIVSREGSIDHTTKQIHNEICWEHF